MYCNYRPAACRHINHKTFSIYRVLFDGYCLEGAIPIYRTSRKGNACGCRDCRAIGYQKSYNFVFWLPVFF